MEEHTVEIVLHFKNFLLQQSLISSRQINFTIQETSLVSQTFYSPGRRYYLRQFFLLLASGRGIYFNLLAVQPWASYLTTLCLTRSSRIYEENSNSCLRELLQV